MISPSQHRWADVIHRLEAGGSMLPDSPNNLKQIIGIYKAYAVPMDFYWRDLLYIAEQVFLNPLPAFKYLLPQEYLDRPNSYAGPAGSPRIWRGEASAHPELLAFMAKGEMGAEWNGGFFCPCHGSKFDFAGRVFSGSPAPVNLKVPPYKFVGDNKVIIGDDSKGA